MRFQLLHFQKYICNICAEKCDIKLKHLVVQGYNKILHAHILLKYESFPILTTVDDSSSQLI